MQSHFSSRFGRLPGLSERAMLPGTGFFLAGTVSLVLCGMIAGMAAIL